MLVGSSENDDTNEAESNEDIFLESLVWAHKARDLAGVTAKVSSITFGQRHLPSLEECGTERISGCTATAVSKTRFMEDRPSHGISIDLQSKTAGSLPSAQQLQWLLTASGETCAAIRYNQLFVERISTAPAAPRPRRGLKMRPELCCVIAGGTKGLGLQCAKQLALGGCKQLVLTSRSGTLAPEDAAEFAALGTSVVVRQCDASSPEDCAVFAAWLRESMPAVQVFAHAAGVLAFDLLPDMTEAAFLSSVTPKGVGACALSEAGVPVEAVFLFSSTAAVWSQAGAAHYASGNACLDALAQQWQSVGLPGTTVNFGPFGNDGMAASLG